MRDGGELPAGALGGVLAAAVVGALGWVWLRFRRVGVFPCWQVARALARLMLAGQADTQATAPERVLISAAERPGAPPSDSEVDRSRELRQEGNAAYADGRFEEAVVHYSEAALLNPSDHLLYSNRSACWLRLSRPVEALDDAELCTKLAPDFSRGFLRKGDAEKRLDRRVDAQASFRRGLEKEPESAALQHALGELRADAGGGLQATLYHVLFVSPELQMDRLFQVLEDPERLTPAYVEQHKVELDAQYECLNQTLRVDLSLLLASPVLRDAYDRVTFACGQLLQWAPEAVSRHLPQAWRIVEGLGLALRVGWSIHHGVAKFSANALTILATSDGAHDGLRREAVRQLLGGMLRWLLDPSPEPENPPEDRDVCGEQGVCLVSANAITAHKVMLTDVAGKGHFCHSHFAGGALAGAAAGGLLGFKISGSESNDAGIAGSACSALTTVVGAVGGAVAAHAASGALGASCGGVAVVIYSLRKVEFDSKDPQALRTMGTGLTATTRKGTVAVRIGMNGHSLVLASTHGTEGVRAKERSAQCPAGSDEAEGGLAEERDAASRTSAPRSGSSASFAGAAQACSGAATSTPARWSRVGPGRAAPCGRGAPPSPLRTSHAWRAAVTSRRRAGSLVTFSSLLEGSGLSEARGLRCPTYKKQKEFGS
ncbi:unnamed protein product [Prorocentrum cordatum]|uniref:Uncharacterized protein n=1 Tax=Prorocentrum cordatum TaxID=2364126 RepID=A0ABN9PXJ9_9DINO|nr:unnamed protein product [Polarella glacialis]